ncbi:MAG: hypothetical protein PWP58_1341 [Bacillota bacterium]|jgi:predicted phosphodiesterase|nr:hypothetical protein [Bacillota bacterium]MDK2883005.1 hypothetical protein [Bacillota bacterium]
MRRKALLFLACSLLGGVIALFFASSATYHLGALRFSARLRPGLGRTVLEFPPVGTVEARTHLVPFDLVLTLENVDLDQVQRLLGTSQARQVVLAGLKEGGRRIAAHFFLRSFALAALGGAWGASWLYRSWKERARGAAVASVAYLILATVAAASFDLKAFQNPSYTGILKGAPWVLGMAQTAWQRLDILGGEIKLFTQNVREAMEKANALAPLPRLQDDLKVLHVSDLHNNSLGLSFVGQIIESFAPDLIVDTGDLTDFGTPLEEGILAKLPSLKIPYYVVLGNHDSPVVAEELRRLAGVHLLDGWSEVKGLTIVGQSDPGSLSRDIKPASPEAVLAQVTDLSAVLQQKSQPPFLLAVHDPRVGEQFMGVVPVVLVGHTHRAEVTLKAGSVMINAGTTGGAGVRGLQGKEEVPLTAALLYVDTSTPSLDAVDIIRLYPRQGKFELSRTTLRGSLES